MTVVETRTAAEQALAHHFDAMAATLPGDAAVRRKAIARFSEIGLPHRRIEEWKYTDVRNSLKVAFPPVQRDRETAGNVDVDRALGELAALDAHRIVLVDGWVVPELSNFNDASSTFKMTALSATTATARGARSRAIDGVLALNDTFAMDGALVRVGATPDKPILVVVLARASSPSLVATQHLIEVDPGVAANVVEFHGRVGSASTQTSAVTTVRVGAGARLTHVKVLRDGADSAHLSHADVVLDETAVYRSFQLTAGAGLARNETHVSFTGADAKLDISGLMLGRGGDHIDTTLVIDHATPGCESRELFKAVLDDHARAVFQGKVIVQPDAQQTDGKQMAQALMLSQDCEFNSKPELEIYADDVACGHGSTAADLDDGMLFYLRSRGIPLGEARAMLIESFAAEALDKIEHDALREACSAVVLAWLRSAA